MELSVPKEELEIVLQRLNPITYVSKNGVIVDNEGNIYLESSSKKMIKLIESKQEAKEIFGCDIILSKKGWIHIKILLWPYKFCISQHFVFCETWDQALDLKTLISSFDDRCSEWIKAIHLFYSLKGLDLNRLQEVYLYRLYKRKTKTNKKILCVELKVY